MSQSDDEDLRRAIALSLQESSPKSSKPVVIDLTSDDEDDDLDAPVRTQVPKPSNQPFQKNGGYASMKPSQSPPAKFAANEYEDQMKSVPPSGIEPRLVSDGTPKSPPVLIATSMFGLDRAKMEAERLARVQKRKEKADEESLSGLNESRKRQAPEPLSRSHDDRLVKAKISTPSQLARTPSPTLPSALVSGNQTRNAPLMHGFLSPTRPEAASGADFQSLNSMTQQKAQQPISGIDERQSSKTLSEGRSRTSSTPYTQSSRSLDIRELPSGTVSSQPSTSEFQRTASEVPSFKQQQALRASGIQYPDGVVKRTWVRDCPQEEDTIKIEEVFQKDDLELAVLSAFQVDPDWVSTKLLDRTKVIWVLSAKDDEEKRNLQHAAPKNYRFCFPSLEGNINIVCFLIDLPRLTEGKVTDAGETSLFGKELVRFIKAMGLDPKVVNSLNRFDFSRTSSFGFVHSIGGSHSGEDWKLTGYCGLGTALRSLGLGTEDALSIDVVTSSIGSIDGNFMKAFYLAAQGDNGETEYGWRANKPSKGKAGTETYAERKISDGLRDRFRIYFPSRETVAESRGGIGAAGTICFQPKWYDSITFPRHIMRDAKSRRDVLMHNKMIFVQSGTPHKQGRAWAYVGSANLSESAWGRLVKDRTTKEPKLNCRNWECGVLFPVPEDPRGSGSDAGAQVGPAKEGSEGDSQGSASDLEVFRRHVPVPMIVPGEKYGAKRPWFYQA